MGDAAAEEQARLRQAVQKAKEGDSEGARLLFEEICTANNDCEAGWLWLASLVKDPETGRDCLNEVLRINPENRTAKAWLAKSEAPALKPAPRRILKCPLCRTAWQEEMLECHSCHALFDLSDPSAFAARDQVHRRVMENAIERLSKTEDSNVFDTVFLLAVANLNLLRSREALKHLRRATKIRGGDPRLRNGEILKRYTSRPCVLIVDDSPTVREVTGRTMEKAGFMAVQAASGNEALELLPEITPSLMLLDIAMPGMDGYQLCKTLRGAAATKSLPVVLISSHDGIFDKAKGKMAGATDHVSKPFEPDELLRVIEKHMGDKP